ncbi:Manganese ABC transporter, periplasmic-binding protein SitA [Clostridiaceae bacterium JG1575]|nr:Manganese ABC transporter, periplasmic-binding protein SitA [Clostridiaceae bacterium JG1575]
MMNQQNQHAGNGRRTSGKAVRSLFLFLMATLVVAPVLAGCAPKGGGNANGEGKLKIVATTTMLADLALQIGKDQVQVESLMGTGVDPHLYTASAGDVKKLKDAQVVVINGLHLEGKMGDVFASIASKGDGIIRIEDGIPKDRLLADEDDASHPDPHIWFDVKIWQDAAKHLAKGLAKVDEKNKAAYEANLAAYLKELDSLDQYVKDQVAQVPQGQRVLVTAHDAFRHFARAYGFKVLGLQGISTDAEAGTKDVANLADFIAKNKIKAIFVESSVPKKNVEALQAAVKARGFSTEIGGELYSDSLGDAKSGHETYAATIKANIDTITKALK